VVFRLDKEDNKKHMEILYQKVLKIQQFTYTPAAKSPVEVIHRAQ
jgi:hypothetical protein